jgi:hypothetical protein
MRLQKGTRAPYIRWTTQHLMSMTQQHDDVVMNVKTMTPELYGHMS